MKNILFFEPTKTVRSMFEANINKEKYNVIYTSTIKDFFNEINEFNAHLILINSSFDQPSGFSFANLIHNFKNLKNVPVRLYSIRQHAYDEKKLIFSEAEKLVYLYKNTFEKDLSNLLLIEENNEEEKNTEKTKIDDDLFSQKNVIKVYSECWEKNTIRTIVVSELYKIIQKAKNVEDVVSDFLMLITNTLKVPAATVCLKNNVEVKIFELFAEKIPEKEIKDFVKVCQADYEKNILNSNKSNVSIIKILPDDKTNQLLTKNYNSAIPLSAYKSLNLYDENKNIIGTVNIIKDGILTKDNQSLFEFIVSNADTLFTNALFLEKKLYFEKNIRKAFNRFVPEQIIDDLVKEAGENKKLAVGEKREVAILFSDIRSFTNISEVNKPEVIVGFLNHYFTIMVDIIKKYGGTVDKFIGDAIMALFGTPISYEDNAKRAVLAAYEMRQALETITLGDLVMPKGMKFNIGIGIHYGDVIAGSLGSKDKTDYTVIGDSVNLASRLEGLTKTYGTQVLISESVKNDIMRSENNFVFRYLDDVKVKGKAVAVPIFAVDRNENEFSTEYKDSYIKGTSLYKQGVFNLAKEYFDKCLSLYPEDKAAQLMNDRCVEFINNPPENWDGAISFKTK